MDNGKIRLTGLVRAMGNADFDLEAYTRSESFKTILKHMECMNANSDEGSEGTFRYWRDMGLEKELHDTETIDTKWASYLPMSYVNGVTPEKRYPLLFVLHGANNPIYLAESYGYTHLAAREELIVIIPENESAENIDKLYSYALEHFPVDTGRVYMVGYSLGGAMTSRHALRWPERFAAVGVGGMLMANGSMGTYWHHDVAWPGEELTEEMIANAADVKIPVCICMGENEFINLLPVTKDAPQPESHPSEESKSDRPATKLDLSSSNKIASINNWRRVAGCKPISEEAVRDAARYAPDIVIEKLGFPFEETRVINIEGRSCYIGDCVNPDGDTLARFACIGKSPHWPCASLIEITWDFIKRYSRDPDTGELKTLG